MMENKSLLFFTSATGEYTNFIPIYTIFAGKHNRGASFEFIVRESDDLIKKHGKSIEKISDKFDVKIKLSNCKESRKEIYHDNSLRFTHTPSIISDYIYIGDIDILIDKNILEVYKKIIYKGLPYCNVVRPKSFLKEPKLTGLHFAKYSSHYPLPEINDIKKNLTDEQLLYKICERKGILYKDIPQEVIERKRPQCGIHMSPNRYPFGQMNWGIPTEYKRISSLIKLLEEEEEIIESLFFISKKLIFSVYSILQGINSLVSNQKEYNELIEKWSLKKSYASYLG